MWLRLKLEKENQSDLPTKTLNTILKKKITSVPEKIFFVLRYLLRNGEQSFEDLLLTGKSRSDLIALFMAILSLIRGGRIMCLDAGENPMIRICPKTQDTVHGVEKEENEEDEEDEER
jgi:chromatin segregation and condensation protein Rec8/ScpA/Scc1 (kleisin family)